MLYEMVDGAAAVPRRQHGAAGAHDPLAHPAAAGARALSRAAAPHPDEGAWRPIPRRATSRRADFAADLEAFRAGGPVAARMTRRSGRDAPDVPRARTPDDETRRTVRDDDATTATEPRAGAAAARRSAKARNAPRRRSTCTHARRVACWSLASVLYGCVGRRLGLSDCISTGSNWSATSRPSSSPTRTRSGTDGRNFPRVIRRLSCCAGREKLVKQKLRRGGGSRDRHLPEQRRRVYEKDWKRARTMAAHALAVDPDDAVRGKLRLTEGHIARINGTAHRNAAGAERRRWRSSTKRSSCMPQLARSAAGPGARCTSTG